MQIDKSWSFTYVVDRISVELLEAMRRVAHRDDAVRNDVGQVQVEVAVVHATPIAADELTDLIDHCDSPAIIISNNS